MPPLHLLIKPASSACNLACRYCFYADVSSKRDVRSYGKMSEETLENLVRKTFETAEDSVTFAFQGGEPTLAGLDFYRHLVRLEEKYNTNGLKISHAIQTNGILLNEEWARFLKAQNFLVGLSLDGTRGMHDRKRVHPGGEGSFKEVWASAQLLEQHGVPFNILTVVTRDIAEHAGRVYDFYMSHGLAYQQYIACLDPLGEARGDEDWSLTPAAYGQFLCDLFDMWYQDITRGRFVYIRYFENLVGMLKGYPPENCGMAGVCSRQLVVEADGEVYPCDFYVLDRWKLGNINEADFSDIEAKRDETRFVELSRPVAIDCQACRFQPICRGGCRRDREPEGAGEMSLNYFCESYKRFFSYALGRLGLLSRQVNQAAR